MSRKKELKDVSDPSKDMDINSRSNSTDILKNFVTIEDLQRLEQKQNVQHAIIQKTIIALHVEVYDYFNRFRKFQEDEKAARRERPY